MKERKSMPPEYYDEAHQQEADEAIESVQGSDERERPRFEDILADYPNICPSPLLLIIAGSNRIISSQSTSTKEGTCFLELLQERETAKAIKKKRIKK